MKPYFSHDFDTRNSRKIKKLLSVHGMQGYGIYWAIAEDLYNNANAMRTDCELIAFDLRVDAEVVRSIIFDFDLFIIDENTFSCDEVGERLNQMKIKSEGAAKSAKHRWDRQESERNANAMQTQSESMLIKSKIKRNTTTTTTTTTTTGEADFVEIDFENEIRDYFEINIPHGANLEKEVKTFIQLNELKNWGAAGGRENWRKVADLYIRKIKVEPIKNSHNGNGNNNVSAGKFKPVSDLIAKARQLNGI